jgi:hypothetical protein
VVHVLQHVGQHVHQQQQLLQLASCDGRPMYTNTAMAPGTVLQLQDHTYCVLAPSEQLQDLHGGLHSSSGAMLLPVMGQPGGSSMVLNGTQHMLLLQQHPGVQMPPTSGAAPGQQQQQIGDAELLQLQLMLMDQQL